MLQQCYFISGAWAQMCSTSCWWPSAVPTCWCCSPTAWLCSRSSSPTARAWWWWPPGLTACATWRCQPPCSWWCPSAWRGTTRSAIRKSFKQDPSGSHQHTEGWLTIYIQAEQCLYPNVVSGACPRGSSHSQYSKIPLPCRLSEVDRTTSYN